MELKDSNVFNNFDISKSVEDFLGSRSPSFELNKFMNNNLTALDKTLYRGMPFNKYFIKKGFKIEDWYGFGHWSDDIEIAKIFSKDYVNDEYVEELINEYGKSNVELVNAIFIINKLVCFPSCDYLDKSSAFYKEREYTTINSSYLIEDYYEGNEFYFVNVKQIS